MRWEFRTLTAWPGQHTQYRQRARFRVSWDDTINLLTYEASRLDATLIVIQLAVAAAQLRRDGMPRADAHPTHPGVRVALDSHHGPLTYSSDHYDDWRDNVRGIALGLEALRAVDRYGVSKRGEQYRGWLAIAAGPAAVGMNREQAASFVAAHARVADAATLLADPTALTRAYRHALRTLHPDAGGNPDQFERLQAAHKILTGQT